MVISRESISYLGKTIVRLIICVILIPLIFTACCVDMGSDPSGGYEYDKDECQDECSDSPLGSFTYNYVSYDPTDNKEHCYCCTYDCDVCDNNATTTTTTAATDNTCPGTPTVIYEETTYNTVQIGDQCWLKENLNIGTMITTSPDQEQDQENNGTMEKYCYDNNPTNCDTYGGLYEWDEAMQYTNSVGSQGVCPEGWHIPTLADFDTLIAAVNNDGNALKAIGEGTDSGAGTNTSGFSVLLAGYETTNSFNYFAEYASFWSSTEVNSYDKAKSMSLNYYDSEISLVDNAKIHGFSVRCVKDELNP